MNPSLPLRRSPWVDAWSRLRRAALLLFAALLAPACGSGGSGAVPLAPPIAGNLWVTTTGTYKAYLQSIADSAGGAFLAWIEASGSGAVELRAQRLNAAGQPLWATEGIKVNDSIGTPLYPFLPAFPPMVPDGSGGLIFTWMDVRNANGDIYAQRLSANGAALWTAGGIPISTEASDQMNPRICSDGAGGAVIGWDDRRNLPTTGPDIFAQKVTAAGAVQWTVDGVLVSAVSWPQSELQMVSDDAGGAILTWESARVGPYFEIYAQRLDPSGAPLWTVNGNVVSTGFRDRRYPRLCPDGSGGAVISWWDERNGLASGVDVFAQRVDASGAMLWTANGAPITTASGQQSLSKLIPVAGGGAIILWSDGQDPLGYTKVFSQRVNGVGAPQWAVNGIEVSGSSEFVTDLDADSDGLGGVVVTWRDFRNTIDYDLYAQRVDASGSLLWSPGGERVSTAPLDQDTPRIVRSGSTLIVSWLDYRFGYPQDQILAQVLKLDGTAIPTVPAGPPLTLWSNVNVPVCILPSEQSGPKLVPDGTGGAILTWQDRRSGNFEIYAQRVNSSGTPQWATNGVPIGQVAVASDLPLIVSDGTGGAIIAWTAGANPDIQAQRIDSAGNPLWSAGGVSVCSGAFNKSSLFLVPDGAGGAFFMWQDYRNLGVSGIDLYAQRLDSSGTALWSATGAPLVTAAGLQAGIDIAPDGSGGLISAWTDSRSGLPRAVYAQRLNGTGTPQWGIDGIAICPVASDQEEVGMVSDAAGGAIICWKDGRAGPFEDDLYAQRVNASGTPQWAANGVAVCIAPNAQWNHLAVPDAAGGVFVCWNDHRAGGTSQQVFGQRVDAGGSPQWAANGIPLSTEVAVNQVNHAIQDGSGGFLITWDDLMDPWDHVSAQRITAGGVLLWAPKGVAFSTSRGPRIANLASDGAGGFIAAWNDGRRRLGAPDIYVQRVTSSGGP